MEYLNIASRQPLLTATEEIILGRAVQAMLGLPDGPLDRQQRGIKRHGMKARERMVAANMRLVMSVAKKYHRFARHLQLEDMLQEGTIGLVRAVEKFDPERGYKFSTYSYWWIRQSIIRAIATYDRSIRLPQHQYERLMKLKAWLNEQSALNRCRPSLDECAAFLDCDLETVRDLLLHSQDANSLDAFIKGTDSKSSTLLDLIADDRDLPWDVVARDYSDEMQTLKAVIPQLPERQREYMQLRLSPDFFSRSQLAKQLGISRERARQIEQLSINQIQLRLRIA